MTDAPTTAPEPLDTSRPRIPAPALPADATVGEVLTAYLSGQAGAFLRALPLAVGEAGSRPGALPASAAGANDLLRSVRRIGGALHTFGVAFDPVWVQESRVELRWLLNLLGQEPTFQRRSARLLAALDTLSDTDPDTPGMLAGHSGSPKARALLDRQLTLARTRAHTTLLQELRSARLHALADRMTLLAGEAPLLERAAAQPAEELLPLVGAALTALVTWVDGLPLPRGAAAYSGEGMRRLGAVPKARGPVADAESALAADDAPWLRVRILARRARYALEVCGVPWAPLVEVDRTLDRHQQSADAAATAATAASTPRITPATAYVLGVVHADQRLDVEAARYAFRHQWPNLSAGIAGWEIPELPRMD